MMTVATVESKDVEIDDIDVDIDDSGNFYLKQGDDWVMLPCKRMSALLEGLAKVHT